MVDSVPAALPSRPDPPVNEHRSSPIVQEVSTPITRFGNPPTTKPTDTTELEDKPYYPRVKEALTKVFRLQSFRTLQLEVICDVMEGLDVFVLFPTGSGKSLTFQLPAVCQDGMTIVVSPLKSLILDQHRALRALGVDVEMLLGEMADSQRKEVWRRLGSGHVPKILYLTPERLEMDGMRSLLQRLQSSGSLARFVIDEAHLITDWGRSFRDAYVQLNTLRTAYPGVPISALTATASPEVQGDITTRLHLKIHAPWKLSANRPNLDYDVRPKTKNVLSEIADFIKNNHPRETGIIYCSSRDKCEEVAKVLRDKFQLSAKHYHAGMADQDKAQVQEEWSSGRIRIIVATIAFGMGIDKPDVRYVIHHSLPNSLNGYYQETGRGGRDGKPAQCILYYSTGDFYNRLRMIRGNPPSQMRDAEEDDIRRVMGYVTNDVQCRRAQVLAFFHEDFDPVHCRQMCNNCRDNTPCVTEDHTADAQKALRLFESLSRRPRARLTPPQFIAALKGSKAQMQVERGWTNDPLHGSCSHLSNDVLARLIDQMLWHNFLSIEQVRGSKDGYCQNYLTVSLSAAQPAFAQLMPTCPSLGPKRMRCGEASSSCCRSVLAGRVEPRVCGRQTAADQYRTL
ncbi:ATP-dependent RNA helicase [Trametes coccinea BRFM310]|uniref:ATP-dependent DNA helicase n=1 Tax=Trametes coccinea (strain BRFM310) TaxID=1353009 RepID=A0A1Y2IS42_TRAC3|nr:ATP-dependent RNA helicase [Trametes coccinea BRFM310]